MSDAFLGSRLEYARDGLDVGNLHTDPVEQLRVWLDDAIREGVLEPTAMCLATADATGYPSSRMVLMRGLDERGLTFYTNYQSQKGEDLTSNPRASVCFWWGLLERQVRVRGAVEVLSAGESDAYFMARPPGSRKASAASPQSSVVSDRQELERLLEATPDDVNRPAHWGGYLLRPEEFEFWQGRPARLHDRFRYRLDGGLWLIERLAP